MNSKQVLLVLCSLLAGVAAKDYYGFYGNYEDLYTKSQALTVGSDQCACGSSSTTGASSTTSATTSSASSTTNAASGSFEADQVITCPVPLMDYLFNLSYALQGTSFYQSYISTLMDIQSQTLCGASMSDDSKMIDIICELQKEFKNNPGMEALLASQQLAGFGSFSDLLSVETEYEMSTASQLLAFDGTSCMLFEGFLNNTALPSACVTALQALFSSLSTKVYSSQYSTTDKIAFIYEAFSTFIAQNPQWASALESVSIKGFGCFDGWMSLGETYYSIWNMDEQLSGDAQSNVLLEAILAFTQNASIDIGVRLQVKNFYNELMAEFASTNDTMLRLQYLMNLTQQFENIAGFDMSYLLGIEYCYMSADGIQVCQTLGDLLQQAYYIFKYGLTIGYPVLPTTSTSTTTRAPTTTVNPLYICSNQSIAYFMTASSQYNGLTPLSYYMNQTVYSTSCTVICKNILNPVVTRVQNTTVVLSNNGSTTQQKVDAVFKNYLGTNPTNNANYQRLILQTALYVNGVYWGRVCDLAACTQQTSANLSCSF